MEKQITEPARPAFTQTWKQKIWKCNFLKLFICPHTARKSLGTPVFDEPPFKNVELESRLIPF
jgi:hypothetical protein